jgi:A/G-specific adenine glycosylase
MRSNDVAKLISQRTKIADFQSRIVRWFQKSARDLPWRKTSDPYKIWISEIMLQQTQVATVIPYYRRFLEKFPDISSLARASEREVLQLWQGLGYYRRGKNLRLAAKILVEKFAGKFPDTREELLEIPGIGPYSAGAILSIAFRKTEPALDGNLIRVYARYHGIRGYVNDAKTLKLLWDLARIYAPEDPRLSRDFTEGMMELGALVCTPKKPLCSKCPHSIACIAFRENDVDLLPRKRVGRKREKRFERILFLRKGRKIAFYPKGVDRKYPDFMRLPFQSIEAPSPNERFLRKYRYSVTNRDFQVFLVERLSLSQKIVWRSASQVSRLLLPAIDRKILRSFELSE